MIDGIAGTPSNVETDTPGEGAEDLGAFGPVRVPKDLGWDRDALADFFAHMQDLVSVGQDPVDARYQPLLYTIEHDFEPHHLDWVDDFLGLPHPHWTRTDKEDTIEFLEAAGYPEADVLHHLPDVDGLTLAHVAGYLHFFHHVFVPYDEATCMSLARLGLDIPFTQDVDAETYGRYTEAIEELKEAAPFWGFPERNLSLQRVMQVALAAWA